MAGMLSVGVGVGAQKHKMTDPEVRQDDVGNVGTKYFTMNKRNGFILSGGEERGTTSRLSLKKTKLGSCGLSLDLTHMDTCTPFSVFRGNFCCPEQIHHEDNDAWASESFSCMGPLHAELGGALGGMGKLGCENEAPLGSHF